MAKLAKFLQGVAGAAGGAGGAGGLNVEDVFSVNIYTGTGGGQVVENGINLGNSNSGGSVDFSGPSQDTDFIYIPYDSSFDLGSSNYTIEFWIYIKQTAPSYHIPLSYLWDSADSSNRHIVFTVNNDSSVTCYWNNTSGYGNHTSTVNIGAWNHIALVRNGQDIYLSVNGSLDTMDTNFTNTYSTISKPVVIGNSYNSSSPSSYSVNGFMSNVRVVIGSALYTSNFTPPTSELTAVSGTVLLTCQGSDPFSDVSGNHTPDNQGGVAVDFGPFDAADAGEGGLVWHKYRGGVSDHGLFDTERGVSRKLSSNNTDAQTAALSGYGITAFNSNGYTLGTQYSGENGSGNEVASWTFRKAPKFFTCLTYTGDGVGGRTVSHDLDSTVGSIIVKRTDSLTNWVVWHRSTGDNHVTYLNLTNASASNSTMIKSASSSAFTLGNSAAVNASGATYVAYLFAHNDGDGEFGPTGDQDIIKCGSYTGNGSTDGPEIDLGFEPQWVLIKQTTVSGDGWHLFDTMRGLPTNSRYQALLQPHTSAAEIGDLGASVLEVLPNGFKLNNSSFDNVSGYNYIYIAIRRGPMAVPESATDVFVTRYRGENTVSQPPMFYSGWPVDMAFQNNNLTSSTSDNRFSTRLTGHHYLVSSSTAAENTGASSYTWDYMDGWVNATGTSTTYRSWMWRRAPNFFDVVAYTGDGVAGRTVSHNLGVAPEMMWVKRRDGSGGGWMVYHKDLGNTKYLQLEDTYAAGTLSSAWNNTSPTDTDFTLGTFLWVNYSSYTYIAYLFASLDGISKVGSYTGNGSTQTINCGFSSGARFVLIKRTDSTGDWYVWDTERGIVAANDPHLSLNTTAAEVTTDDSVDPVSSGFAVNQVAATNINVSSASYIFYAIA